MGAPTVTATCVTAAVIAASIALPPCFNASSPARAAIPLYATVTAPLRPVATPASVRFTSCAFRNFAYSPFGQTEGERLTAPFVCSVALVVSDNVSDHANSLVRNDDLFRIVFSQKLYFSAN